MKKRGSNRIGKLQTQFASVRSGDPNKRPSLSSTHSLPRPHIIFAGGERRGAQPVSRRRRDLHRARLRRYASLANPPQHRVLKALACPATALSRRRVLQARRSVRPRARTGLPRPCVCNQQATCCDATRSAMHWKLV